MKKQDPEPPKARHASMPDGNTLGKYLPMKSAIKRQQTTLNQKKRLTTRNKATIAIQVASKDEIDKMDEKKFKLG